MSQWHRSPFDEKNADEVYLHRSMAILGCEEALLANSADENSARHEEKVDDLSTMEMEAPSHNKINYDSEPVFRVSMNALQVTTLGDSAEPIIHQAGSLVDVYVGLIQSRRQLWDQIERSLVLLIETLSFSAAMSTEDFCKSIHALQMFADIGNEFCRSNSKALRCVIQFKTALYIEEIRNDTLIVFRQVIETEPWRCFPVEGTEHGGGRWNQILFLYSTCMVLTVAYWAVFY